MRTPPFSYAQREAALPRVERHAEHRMVGPTVGPVNGSAAGVLPDGDVARWGPLAGAAGWPVKWAMAFFAQGT